MNKTKVLLVEDNVTDQMNFERYVEEQKLPYIYTIVPSVEEAKKALKQQQFDIVLIDYKLNDGTGFDVLEAVKGDLPTIFITGSGTEELAVKALRKGASDYLKKDIDDNYLTLIPLTIEHALKAQEIANELEEHKQHLEKLVEERTFALKQEISDKESAQIKLAEEKERVHVTLESIGDAVIATNLDGTVDYLNAVAEELTGWNLADAKGQRLDMVFNIVNEATRIKCENPVVRCLRENKIIGLANHTLLISKGGLELSIEDSAAPITDYKGKIIGVVLVFHDVTQARRMASELSYQATHDALTDLCNRREFERRLHNAISNAYERSLNHAILYIDLDQFKVINDTCGHVAGDELLRQISNILEEPLREGDTLARLGGDEFGVLLENCHLGKASQIAQSICLLIKEHLFVWEAHPFHIGASIGLVPITKDTSTLAELMSAADMACYTAKEHGRNCVHIVDDSDKEVLQKKGELLWLGRLRKAIAEDKFELYFQKINVLNSVDETVHIELLLRLNDEGEIVTPNSFIPAAERYNLMPDIDRWVIEKTFSYYDVNKNEVLHQCKTKNCTINLCGASMCDPTLIDFIIGKQNQYNISPEFICFEITETAAITNLNKATKFINSLKKIGYSFALDDFGSGMSSFAYLKNLPVDYLKIDGVFVREIANNSIDFAMVKSINEIGHAMGLKTVAEFVENQEILDKLVEIGVDYVQGYHIHKPEPLNKLV